MSCPITCQIGVMGGVNEVVGKGAVHVLVDRGVHPGDDVVVAAQQKLQEALSRHLS